MFGLFVSIIIVAYLIYSSIVNSYDDGQGKRKYKDPTTNTYLDHNGVSRDLKTNKHRAIFSDYHGDRHIRGKDIGDINVSQQERQKEYLQYKEALKNGQDIGRTTIYWEPSPFYKVGAINLLGLRYKDIATGNVFIVRNHRNKDYYVDIDTLKVIRYTDFQRNFFIEKNMYNKEKEYEDVTDFQKTIDFQRYNKSYIGDPTKGIGCQNVSTLKDIWKPTKVMY